MIRFRPDAIDIGDASRTGAKREGGPDNDRSIHPPVADGGGRERNRTGIDGSKFRAGETEDCKLKSSILVVPAAAALN